ncbi:hypothetical protein EG857_15225, partial [Enterococcus faecalis]
SLPGPGGSGLEVRVRFSRPGVASRFGSGRRSPVRRRFRSSLRPAGGALGARAERAGAGGATAGVAGGLKGLGEGETGVSGVSRVAGGGGETTTQHRDHHKT